VHDVRRLLRGRAIVRHRRLDVELDLDEIARVLGHVPAHGDDENDRIADVTHVADCQWWRHRERLSEHRVVRLAEAAVEVAPCEHAHDAGQRLSGRGVNAQDHGSSDVAADECAVKHPREDDVVDVAAMAGEEAPVLLALDRLPDEAGGDRAERLDHADIVRSLRLPNRPGRIDPSKCRCPLSGHRRDDRAERLNPAEAAPWQARKFNLLFFRARSRVAAGG
jgi:hypothetical protein